MIPVVESPCVRLVQARHELRSLIACFKERPFSFEICMWDGIRNPFSNCASAAAKLTNFCDETVQQKCPFQQRHCESPVRATSLQAPAIRAWLDCIATHNSELVLCLSFADMGYPFVDRINTAFGNSKVPDSASDMTKTAFGRSVNGLASDARICISLQLSIFAGRILLRYRQ